MFDYSKIDWNKNGKHTKIDLYSCNFSLNEDTNQFIFSIVGISVNGTDLLSGVDDFVNGPFIVRLNKKLNLSNIRSIDVDEDNQTLTINGDVYYIIYSDFVYFLSDFNADTEQAYGNLLSRLKDYIVREYM